VLNSPALLLANINFEPASAAETLREPLQQNSIAQQCQYRPPLLYLLHVLAQSLHPSWPWLCERGVIIHRREWHFMSKKKISQYHYKTDLDDNHQRISLFESQTV